MDPETRQILQEIRESLRENEERTKELCLAVLGNGKPEECLRVRMMVCETNLKRVMLIGAAFIGTILTAAVGLAFK